MNDFGKKMGNEKERAEEEKATERRKRWKYIELQ
jgi:hypothetical protein